MSYLPHSPNDIASPFVMIKCSRLHRSYIIYLLLFFPLVVSARALTEAELLAAITVRACLPSIHLDVIFTVLLLSTS